MTPEKMNELREGILRAVTPMLIGPERASEMQLENHPHRVFKNLTVLYSIIVNESDNVINGIIMSELTDSFSLTDDELHEAALNNLRKHVSLDEVFGLNVIKDKEFCYHAAAAMLLPDVLMAMANRLESDFFILPSSIYELICLPTGAFTAEDALSFVTQVNRNTFFTGPKEKLSDSVYLFNRSTGQVSIAATEVRKNEK